MSEHLHPGLHPDPDSLSAFIEGVLPEHERLQCLAHLAECSSCREVVFLAQEPRPAPAVSNPTPAWRRWFAPVPVLAAAAAVCIAVLAVWLYLHRVGGAPSRDEVARVGQAPPTPAPPSTDLRPEAGEPPPIAPKARAARRTATAANSHATPHSTVALPAAGSTESATASTTAPSLPPPPAIPIQSDTSQNPLPPALRSSVALPARPPTIDIDIKEDRVLADGLSGISGTVIDQSGAAVPAATVKLRQLPGTFSRDARTDLMGQFQLAGLPAGHYELQISAPGFRQTARQIDLQPREMATISSELAIGSMSETVEVTASSSRVQTSNAAMTGSKANRKAASPARPRSLPSRLSASITVTSGKVMLAVDSAGALFVSRNGGRGWKAIKPLWHGKVVHLVTPAEPPQTPIAVFQLTTDSDSEWLSRDGSHWFPAPPLH
jgi:hypothetical protein